MKEKSWRETLENRGPRTLAVLWSAWLDALHRRCYTKWKLHQHSECFRAAERVCGIGFDNPKDIQDHLSAAKDHLYQAAIRFKAEADSASNHRI